jgi:DNA-binding NarL/FixJ family response regulator
MELTPRQAQVASLVAQGKSNKAIASELGVSLQTVKDHISDAACRLPGDGRPRYKLIVLMLNPPDPEADAA